MFKKYLNALLAVLILTILSIVGMLYFKYRTYHPSTDDAYIQAHVVHVAPQISATTQSVPIRNHQYVKSGQLLVSLDPIPFTIAVEKAEANLKDTKQEIKSEEADIATAKANVEQAQAQLTNTQKSTDRILTLVNKKLLSPSEGDQATSDLEVAKATLHQKQSELLSAQQQLGDASDTNASIQAAKADLDSAKLNLHYTKIYAPTSGYIANLSLRPGDQLTAYNEIFALVDNEHWWVDANFKETQLEHIQTGQTAAIITDMYPHHVFKGTVEFISIGSGSSFSLLPPENATGNWVKVTQRFPVKILIGNDDPHFKLRLGASATVTINASDDSSE